jgi:hypothetical protein
VNCLKKLDSSSVLIEVVSNDGAAGSTIAITLGCKNLVYKALYRKCLAASLLSDGG